MLLNYVISEPTGDSSTNDNVQHYCIGFKPNQVDVIDF